MSRPPSSSRESHTNPTYPTHSAQSFNPNQRQAGYFDLNIPNNHPNLTSPLHPYDARRSSIHHGYTAPYPGGPNDGIGQSAPNNTTKPTFTSRESGRQKSHVASACINCKRAHLSCDIQRPCGRCVASGKQDSCVDVQHKKRGRPRLRDDGDSAAEQSANEASRQQKTTGAPASSQLQPTAKRQRRADSYSMLSQSEGPSTVPPQSPLQTPSTYHPPPGLTTQQPSYEIPMAYMDLDFVLMRANSSFEQIMFGGQESRGRHLGEIASPADKSEFQSIKDRLREEREQREPSYMPPILQPGLESIFGVSDADVDRLSHGFSDHTYTWTSPRLASSERPVFPARVRLAKANVYFVVVTLPSFRPIDPRPMPRVTAPSLVPPYVRDRTVSYPIEGLGPSRRTESHSAPPQTFLPSPSAGPALIPSPSNPPHLQPTLPQFQAASPYAAHQQPQYPMASKILHPPLLLSPAAEHNTMQSQTPTPSTRPATSPGTLQLPSINYNSRTSISGPSAPQPGEAIRPSTGWVSEGDERSSPKKRRRVGISDMLIS